MQRTAISITLILFLIAGFGILGCGSGNDILDEISYRFDFDVEVQAENNNIDIINDDGSLNTTDITMDLTFTSERRDLEVYRIRIEFEIHNWDPGDTNIDSPSIDGEDFRTSIPVPGSETVRLLLRNRKEAFFNALGANDIERTDNAREIMATYEVTVTAFATYTPNNPKDHLRRKKYFLINILDIDDVPVEVEPED
jgi:hypothetical protein